MLPAVFNRQFPRSRYPVRGIDNRQSPRYRKPSAVRHELGCKEQVGMELISNREALIGELKACDLWDLVFYRKGEPDLEDHIAFATRQIRRRQIIDILSLENLYQTKTFEKNSLARLND